jgi:hypothetical protein
VATKSRRRLPHALILAAGFAIGALPWIAFNVRYPLATFGKNFGSRPAAGGAAMLDNLRYATTTNLPELVASVDPENAAAPSPLQRTLRLPLLLIHLGAAIWVLFAMRRGRISRDAALLLLALIVVTLALNTFSQAGQTRVLSVRYVLALWYVAVAALASATIALSTRSRVAAAAVVAIVLTFHIAGYHLPGQRYREQRERDATVDDRLAQHFLRTNTRTIVGSYWTTYPFAFLTHEQILAIPCRADDDFKKMRTRLPAAPVRIAMIEDAREAENLSARMQRANIGGRLLTIGRYALFEPFDVLDPQRAIAACSQ